MRVSFFKRAAAGQCQCNHAITAPGGGAAIALRGAGHPSYHLTVLVVSSRESLEHGLFFQRILGNLVTFLQYSEMQ